MGESIAVMTFFGTALSVPFLSCLYGVLLALDFPSVVFYIALIGKLMLWLAGHIVSIPMALYGHSYVWPPYSSSMQYTEYGIPARQPYSAVQQAEV